MRALLELVAKLAAARGVSAPAPTQAAIYLADVQAGRHGIGRECRERGACRPYDEYTRPKHLPRICEDCGAPVGAAT